VSIWILIFGLAAFSYLLRVAGPLLLRPGTIPPWLERVLPYLAPAVLGGLIAAGMFTTARSLVIDERAIGFIAAVGAAYLKLPALAVIVLAAAATAVARLVV
jgi:branched-subunit amino acid transport protein